MKIALVAQNATPLHPRAGSGPDRDDIGLSELTRKLASQGHQVTVYTQKNLPDLPEQADLHEGVRVKHIDAGSVAAEPDDADLLEQVPAFSGPLRSHLESDRPDIVHALRWTSGLAALAAARDLGIPVVQEFNSLCVTERRAAAACGTSPARSRRTARRRPGSGSSRPSGAAPPRWSRPTPPRSPAWPAWASSVRRSGSCRGASTPTCSPPRARWPSGTTGPGCWPRRT